MNRRLNCVFGGLWLALGLQAEARAAALNATVNVNASTVQTQFNPWKVFGINIANWISTADQTASRPKVEAAGNYLLRFPGGSLSDGYHWNGTGALDSSFRWVPNNTAYSAGFRCNPRYRGTNSGGDLSLLDDGNNSTYWLSNAETDFPAAQWAYLDLGAARTVNRVDITWATPYATNFQIEGWDPFAGNQWNPYSDGSNNWFNLSLPIAGTGGTQSVTFSAQSTRYVRVLMTASSAGAAGQYALAEMRVFNGSTQLSSNSPTASTQNRSAVSSMDEAVNTAGSWAPGFDFNAFINYCAAFNPKAEPLITVNFGTGTPAEAAAWVHYANVVRGLGIKYWEIGNELDGNWEIGGPLAAADYARRYIKFYEAMKAEDPTIRILGPVVSQPYNSDNMHDGKTYIQAWAERLASAGKGSYAEIVAYHSYPYWTNTVAAQSLATPFSMFPQLASDMGGWLASLPGGGGSLPVYMTEFNSGGASSLTTKLVNGLWLTAWMGEFIEAFGPRAGGMMWDALNGGNSTTQVSGGDHNYLQAENNAYKFQERAHYWAMQMMATQWAMPGSQVLHDLLPATTTQGLLQPYACLRPDGQLSLMLVNLDPSNSYTTTVNLNGFTPASPTTQWTFDSSNYGWTTASLPYHASPNLPPTQSSVAAPSANFSVNAPAYSLVLYRFSPPVPTPTPTISMTPTISPTFTVSPTITVTATPGPPPGQVTVYPNPVHPGKGERLYLGNIKAGSKLRVFNLIGELVYEKDLSGASSADGWDCVNYNGATVVTGTYLLIVSGYPGVYRFAVIRD